MSEAEEVLKSGKTDYLLYPTKLDDLVSLYMKVYFKKENNIDMPDNYSVNHLDIIFIANKNAEFVDFIKPNTSSEDVIKKLVKVIPQIKG